MWGFLQMKRNPISLSITVLILGVFLLGGCQSVSPALPPAQDVAWGEIVLTPEEERWLQSHPTVQVHIENWPPFMIYENGETSGIAMDTLKLLLDQVGLQPEYEESLWVDVLKEYENHTGPDILPVVARTVEREEMMYLTSDYISFPLVIFTQKNSPFVGGVDDLTNHIVAVERGFIAHAKLLTDYPQTRIMVTDTSLEALQAVSTNEADAYIGNLAVGSYLIQEHGLVNLKVAAPTSFEDHKIAIGVRLDEPELASILEKALKAMPEERRNQILQEWLYIRYEYGISQTDVWVRIAATVVVAVIILGFAIFANQRLEREVAETRKAQLALAESETLLRAVIDATPDVILVKDAIGNFILVNRVGAALNNMTPQQMQGLNEMDLIDLAGVDVDTVDNYIRTDRQVIDQKTSIFLPEEPITRGGMGTRWYHTSKIPLETQGKIDKVLVVSTDITERKLALEALKQERTSLTQRVEERTAELVRLNIELQESSRAKDEFLANMSHELRTPLNAILGMSEILGEQLFGHLNPKQLKQVSVIEESGRHLLILINDILDLAKIESGKRELFYQPVNITDLCHSSLSFINAQAVKKNIAVSFEPATSLTAIEADPRSLKQILINLLSNAVKFTQENGQIGLRVEQNDQTETICFTVWDTGIGITPEQSRKLFKPFVQVDSSLTRNYEGTGLGLSLISRLVDMHGGSVQLESRGIHGYGSHFIVHLPLHPTQIQTTLKPEFEGVQIVLMDDEVNSRVRMQTILTRLGCHVHTTQTNFDVIRIAQEIKPDMIFIDTQTPQESTQQAIRQIRQDMKDNTLPVISMTSLMIQQDPALSHSFGTYEHLLKPLSPKKIKQLLKKYLRKE